MFSGCCGQPGPRRITIKKHVEPLPANPDVGSDGVPLLYLGVGRKELRGAETRTYVVADHRRGFVAHSNDVRTLLRNRFVILEPR
jgi:hypothetical protein